MPDPLPPTPVPGSTWLKVVKFIAANWSTIGTIAAAIIAIGTGTAGGWMALLQALAILLAAATGIQVVAYARATHRLMATAEHRYQAALANFPEALKVAAPLSPIVVEGRRCKAAEEGGLSCDEVAPPVEGRRKC